MNTAAILTLAWLGLSILAAAWYVARAPRGAARHIATHKPDTQAHHASPSRKPIVGERGSQVIDTNGLSEDYVPPSASLNQQGAPRPGESEAAP